MIDLRRVLKIKRLRDNVKLPYYASEYAAGMDLHAADDVILEHNKLCKVKTGIAIEIPIGYEGQIRPRSSFGAKNIIIPNSPGTIDSDYRGEIIVMLYNLNTNREFTILAGERIAQLVICKINKFMINEVENLSNTKRGSGGFGSTGK